MNQVTCSGCSRNLPSGETYELNAQFYCGSCVTAAAEKAKEAGQPVSVTRYVDKSICARCSTYIGEGGGVAVGTARVCAPCSALIEDWPYPQWLKVSLAALLLLLVFGLYHGRGYFQAGKQLYRGEQLVETGQYQKALPYLREVIKIAPDSDKAALLAAKAGLLSGDVQTAALALEGHNKGYFEHTDKPEFQEVNRLWKDANTAFEKLAKASKLEESDGHEVQAARLVHEAAAAYPQLPHLDIILDQYDGGVAFVQKDYDKFLALSEKDWKSWPASNTAAMFSSALACKYAVTGDISFRQQSEDMLAKAKEMAHGDREALVKLAEFEERNRYRLETRQIISKSAFDQKFRGAKSDGK